MKHIKLIAIAAFVVILFGGCQSVQINEKTNKDFVFLYGYINMKEYTFGKEMNALTIKQIKPPTDNPYLGVEVLQGYFFNDELLAGIYCLNECGSENGSFTIPVDVGCIEIEKSGGIYYFGSYEIVKKPGDRSVFKKTIKPGEAEVIAQMLKIVVKGSSIEAKLIKRLRVLKEIMQRKKNIPRAQN